VEGILRKLAQGLELNQAEIDEVVFGIREDRFPATQIEWGRRVKWYGCTS